MKRISCCHSKSFDNVTSKLHVIDSFLSAKRIKLADTSTENSTDCNVSSNEKENSSKDACYWPNCDYTVWLRSCEKEVIEPIHGKITGTVPKWLKGTLLRNGPGNLKVGKYTFDHLFDSSALLHRYEIKEGDITYQRRFVQTDVYKRNKAAQRIVVSEFGTKAVPDPCQSIFKRVAAIFNTEENTSDNSMISVYPFGDEYYTFTESPIIHRIDPETLETIAKVNVSNYVNIVNHTSHPHVMNDGTVYNVGLNVSARGPAYSVIRFTNENNENDKNEGKSKLSMFDRATIVGSVPCRWMLNPSYMHSFGITENYYIIVEQPLAVSVIDMMTCKLKRDAMIGCFKWHENENTHIHVLSRKTGKKVKTFVAEKFFFLHVINQFETRDGNHVVIDICCYRDAKMLECMYIDSIKNMQKNPDYANMFRGRPLRFVLPMTKASTNVPMKHNLIDIESVYQSPEFVETNCKKAKERLAKNDSLLHMKATAHRLDKDHVFVKPELLCDLGCETPRINSNFRLGKEYRYFYAISSDVDRENPGTLIKVDALTKTTKTWAEKDVMPSEPIFIPSPDGKKEDDGVILSALVWGQGRETEAGLLILNAETFTEIARATFNTPGPVPKCLHGWFSMEK